MGSKKLQKIQKHPEKPKTRKEIRKDKRTNKKQKRKYFFEHKKELKNEYRKNTNNTIINKKNVKLTKKPSDDKGKVKDINDNGNDEAETAGGDDVDDDEIESDFELSDQEMEKTIQKINTNKKKILEKSTGQKSKSKAKSTTIENPLEDEHKRTLKKERDITKEMRKQRIKQLRHANEEDDKIISQLEKRLKIDKSKYKNKIPKMFNDGLDYAMELCLPENMEKLSGPELSTDAKHRKLKRTGNGDDDDDDDADDDEFGFLLNSDQSDVDDQDLDVKKLKKKSNKNVFDSDEDDDDDEEDEDDDEEDEDEDDESNDDKDSNESFNEIGEDKGDENLNDDNKIQLKSDNWEDIYGRKRDKHGNVIKEQKSIAITTPLTSDTKYIPPHVLRRQNEELAKKNNTISGVQDTKHNEKIQRLRKQLKGLLNRLSEANMHRIANDIEKLYMQNSRYDMNTTLTTLILESLIGNVLSQERLVLEHMMLIAVLHANIGSEIGAHFLQIVIEKFYELYQKINGIDEDVENKEFDNVIFIICHLYTFQIFQYNLIYEILNKLIQHLNEKSVECILLILRSIGFSLRKDDPMALKTFINAIQKRSNDVPDELKNNSRLHYMLDVLMAIKNNNVNKIPQYDSSLSEHLRKILKSMLINGKYVTTINITMNDLLNVNEHGKWWIVGSAWSGKDNPNLDDDQQQQEQLKLSSTSTKNKKPTFNQELLDLAKKQRMNTDDRRNVFCILMSAEDYLESFEKLLHLSIKDHNIIPSVIIHCCLSERKFNPYYLVLTQKFCDFNRKYQLAVQFLLWDRIKDIHGQTQLQCKNMAQFLIRLIETGSLPISVLKIIEFNELDKLTLRFVRQIMVGILLIDDDERCKNVFLRIGPSFKLKQFKDSIRVFMHHFLLTDEIRKSFQNISGGGDGNNVDAGTKKYLLLKKRIEMADLALNLESRVQL